MATNNAIDSAIPIEVLKGGTNSSAMTLTYGVVYYDGNEIVTISSLGTSGQVFTSNGPSSPPTFESSVGGGRPNPGFVARKDTVQASATGDGTVAIVTFQTEVVDTGNDFDLATYTFTASSANIYHFNFLVSIESMGSYGTGYVIEIITSNRTYTMSGSLGFEQGSNTVSKPISTLADMDSSDTAYVAVTMWGQSSKATDLPRSGPSAGEAEFSGYIIGI